MKKLFITLTVFFSLSFPLCSQSFNEPEFIGDAFLIKNNETVPVNKTLATFTAKANATMYIFGVGTIKGRVEIPGAKASVRTESGNIQLIVRAIDNQSDPLSIISIFKFETKKNKRRADVSKAGTFSGAELGNFNAVDFNAKKYGTSSYLVSIPAAAPGEYGITVSNPNNRDGKSIVVSSFGVD